MHYRPSAPNILVTSPAARRPTCCHSGAATEHRRCARRLRRVLLQREPLRKAFVSRSFPARTCSQAKHVRQAFRQARRLGASGKRVLPVGSPANRIDRQLACRAGPGSCSAPAPGKGALNLHAAPRIFRVDPSLQILVIQEPDSPPPSSSTLAVTGCLHITDGDRRRRVSRLGPLGDALSKSFRVQHPDSPIPPSEPAALSLWR